MARIEVDALRDPEQVYLAPSLGEARKVEALVTSRGVDYATQVEVFGRSTLFGSRTESFMVGTGAMPSQGRRADPGRWPSPVQRDGAV